MFLTKILFASFSVYIFILAALTKRTFAVQPHIEAFILESLRDNRVQACDGESVTLHCPRNTHVQVHTVFYGRLVPSSELCPSLTAAETLIDKESQKMSMFTLFDDRGANFASVAKYGVKHVAPFDEDISCDMPEAYARLSAECAGRQKCRVTVSASLFGERDACPSTRKYLQVGYKCRPVSFEDQSFCEGTTMQLGCRARKRLSIYAAQYGRTINGQAQRCNSSVAESYGSVKMRQMKNNSMSEDCVFNVLTPILRACHAQTACALAINDHFLGNPCRSVSLQVAKQLSLIFTCVNEEIFSEASLKSTLETMQAQEEKTSNVKNQTQESKKSSRTPGINKTKKYEKELKLFDEFIDEEEYMDEYEYDGMADEKETLSKVYATDSSTPNSKNERDNFKNMKIEETAVTVGFGANFGIVPNKTLVNLQQDSTGVIDMQGLGFAEDFSAFVRYLKENHEESLLYFFLFIASGIIMLLAACSCCQWRAGESAKQYWPTCKDLYTLRTRKNFFGTTRGTYQTVSVSSSSANSALARSEVFGTVFCGTQGEIASTIKSTASARTNSSSSGSSNASNTNELGHGTVQIYRNQFSGKDCDYHILPSNVKFGSFHKRVPYTAHLEVQQQQQFCDLGSNINPIYSTNNRLIKNLHTTTYASYCDTYDIFDDINPSEYDGNLSNNQACTNVTKIEYNGATHPAALSGAARLDALTPHIPRRFAERAEISYAPISTSFTRLVGEVDILPLTSANRCIASEEIFPRAPLSLHHHS